ncbi:hypothetical protein FLACOL_01946 [Flavobacterium columnare]|uniref:HTH araC/xylS-type domain-containing protein n=2 Tax=Flavobacterium TaxID=237 RepID=A0ABW8PKS3_9FLAO|nr:hypothetical protein [Flavobacterium columnare]SPE77932.1 hypothetical protein FLACOL_01946 [Flavobacterium columnare]
MKTYKIQKRRLLTLFLLFIITFSHSQNLKNKDYSQLKELFLNNKGNKKNQEAISNAFISLARKRKENLQIGKGYNLLYLCTDMEGKNKIKLLDTMIKYTKNDWVKEYDFPEKAYMYKANELRNEYKFNEAMDNLLLAEKYCKLKESNYIYWIYFYIAIIKSEDFGENKESLDINRKVYQYLLKNKDLRDYQKLYRNILFALADNYKSLKITDSCTYYNKLGYKDAIEKADTIYKNLFILNEGANLISKKDYYAALDSINKSLPHVIKNNDEGNALAGYYYMGKAYQGLGKSELAVKNFIKVDSIYKISNDISYEFTDGYDYLIDYYKKKKDIQKQLLYTTQKLKIDTFLNTNYKVLFKKLKEDYEKPNLIENKEKEIRFAYNWIYALIPVFFTILGIILYLKNKQLKASRQKLDLLVKQFENKETKFDINHKTEDNVKETVLKNKEVLIVKGDKTSINLDSVPRKISIDPDTFQDIITKIINFEKKGHYMDPKINATGLAIKLGTNYKYLSEVIKTQKNKSVNQYINDLRIENGLQKIHTDRKLLKYNNEAIAKEFGFNNYKTFKKVFFSTTEVEFQDFVTKINSSENQ